MISSLVVSALLAAVQPAATAPAAPPGMSWRAIATEDDRRRLRGWRGAWMAGLAAARAQGHQAEIAEEGALLDPDVGLTEPTPPSGDYRCRVIKLGSRSRGGLAYVVYPPYTCRVAADAVGLGFTKVDGSQRPIGRFYRDTDLRLVFLGTMQLGDEVRAYQYGIDGDRDMIGLVERIGPSRWRLVLPRPHFESLLDVIELTPL